MKNALATKPVLAIYRIGAETEVHTDASKLGLAGILFQRNTDDGQMHPIQYWSKKTTTTEEKYHSYELETMAVVQALQHWRVYLLGIHFEIITDCKAFKATMDKTDVPKIARWSLVLN